MPQTAAKEEIALPPSAQKQQIGGLGEAASEARLALVDGHSLFHRAFFALPPLTAPDGQPTGALYGFLTMLLRLLEDEQPSHLAVALDRPEPTFRHTQFSSYKAQRAEMPDELRSQLPLLRELLAALRIPVLEQAGAEADDLLGTVATRAAAAGLPVLLVTGDRDALQLVSPLITVLYTRRGLTEIDRMDPPAVEERYGVRPEQMVDVKALVGDTSDNYPGVPTVGEKTACRLVAAFGSAPALLARLEEVGPPRTQQALREHQDVVRRNLRLASIVRDLPLALELEDLRRQRIPGLEAGALLDRLGLGRLGGRLGVAGPAEHGEEPAQDRAAAEASSARQARARLDVPPVERVGAAEFTRGLAAREGLVTLAEGRGPAQALAAWVGERVLLWDGPGEAPALPPLPQLGALETKPLCHRALAAGGSWRTPALDAALGAYLLEPERSTYTLEDLCRRLQLQAPDPGNLPQAAAALAALREPLEQELRELGLWSVYSEIELPLVGVLAAMERAGVLVDRQALAALERDFAARLAEVEAEIYELGGESFNINSTQQLGRILFERLGLTPPKRTKTGFSTDADVLEQLATLHPLPAKVLTHRTLQKLQSTYVQALPGYVAADGRVHTDFRQTVAATGRLASNNPNLQNIPVRDEVGRPIRRVFVAAPGCRLISADYSQIELRVLAHLSGDPGLLAAFAAGGDIHRATAAEVWGVPAVEVTPAQRSAAKAINFGIVYGISDFGLARQLGCPVAEAHQVITRYFQRYPGVRGYMDGVVEEARRTGLVRTMFGRIRRLPDITQRNFARRSLAERTAMNSPVQGTAADLIKRAMIAVHAELERRGSAARLILQVHDELVLEAPEDEAEETAALVARGMRAAGRLSVPLEVDVRSGPNWLDLAPQSL